MPEPFVRFTPNYDWRNKHQNVRRRAARLYSPWNLWEPGSDPTQDWRAGLSGLGQVIREAETSGRRIRPLGGSWSLSDVAASSDFLIDTKALNIMTVGMAEEHLAPAAKDRAKTLVFAQCGVSILELNRKLEGRGLSLKTSGASTGQTIAGALATGTHGSAKEVGSIQEFVVGLHLLGEGGENVWVERKATPIASDAFIAFLGATRVARDDDFFRAALVGVGAFGLVHAVALEVEPIYLLERTIRRFDLRDVRHAIRTLDVGGLNLPGGANPPFHFEVVINPYATGNGEKGAYVRVMYKRPFVNLPAPPPGSPVVTAAGDDLLGVIGDIGDILPGLFPVALGHVLDAQLPPIERALGTHGQTFGSTAIRGAGTSLELGVPLAQAEAAVNVIVDVARERPFGGLIALRYVRSTDARIGFTRFPPVTCTIELPSTLSGRSLDAFESIVEKLAAAAIPFALHWGQHLPVAYTAARVGTIYGSDAQAYRDARRTLLPTAGGRRMFASEALERVGLAD